MAEGLSAAGAIDQELGATAVRVSASADGYYRCYLAGASAEETRLFAESLDELLAPLGSPRYIIPRHVVTPPGTALGALGLLLRMALRLPPGSTVVYHAVPSYLGANKKRAEAFRRAWNRHVSPGRPLYYQDPRSQGILEVQRGEDPFQVTSQMRVLWR